MFWYIGKDAQGQVGTVPSTLLKPVLRKDNWISLSVWVGGLRDLREILREVAKLNLPLKIIFKNNHSIKIEINFFFTAEVPPALPPKPKPIGKTTSSSDIEDYEKMGPGGPAPVIPAKAKKSKSMTEEEKVGWVC